MAVQTSRQHLLGFGLLNDGELCDLFTTAEDIDAMPVALTLLARFPAFARRWRTMEEGSLRPWVDLIYDRRFEVIVQDLRIVQALADLLLAARDADSAASDLAGEYDAVLVPTFLSMLETAPRCDVPMARGEDHPFDRLFSHPVIAAVRSSQGSGYSHQSAVSSQADTAVRPTDEIPETAAHTLTEQSGAGGAGSPVTC
jgi:hypothetical protein